MEVKLWGTKRSNRVLGLLFLAALSLTLALMALKSYFDHDSAKSALAAGIFLLFALILATIIVYNTVILLIKKDAADAEREIEIEDARLQAEEQARRRYERQRQSAEIAHPQGPPPE